LLVLNIEHFSDKVVLPSAGRSNLLPSGQEKKKKTKQLTSAKMKNPNFKQPAIGIA